MLLDSAQKYLGILLTGLALLLPCCVPAQIRNRCHLTLADGLPSNNVYSAHRDYLGYLWLSTEMGLVQYNGYSFNNYTTADGLPSSEVFEVYEDRWHRLWINTISNSIGYVRNNRFRPVHVSEKLRTAVHPSVFIAEGSSGIWICLVRQTGEVVRNTGLFCEVNDTLLSTGLLFGAGSHDGRQRFVLSTRSFATATKSVDYIKRYSARGIENLGQLASPIGWSYHQFCQGDFILLYRANSNDATMRYIRIDRLSQGWKQVVFRDEKGRKDPVSNGFFRQKNPYVMWICERNVYKLDSLQQVQRRYSIAGLTGEPGMPGSAISGLIEDSLWGLCLTTRTRGVYLDYGTDPALRIIDSVDLSEYMPIGSRNDSVSYWWQEPGRRLACIDEKGRVSYLSFPQADFVVQLLSFPDGRRLLLGKQSIHLQQGDSLKPVDLRGADGMLLSPLLTSFRKAIAVPGFGLYVAGNGLYRAELRHDSLYVDTVTHEGRYYGLEYDTAHAGLLMYNNEQAVFYVPGQNRCFYFPGTLLHRYGIRNIEKLYPHRATGTIFLNDHSDLYAVDLLRGSVRRLNTGYNLEGAKLCVRGDRLFLAGGFGVLIARIIGPGQISEPLLYRNIRNSAFRQVKEMVVLDRALVLSTDKQACLVKLPSDSELATAERKRTPYRLTVNYRDTLHGLPLNGPLNITTGGGPLLLDLINPFGAGKPVYRYSLDGSEWQALAGNELNLPALEAGKYHRLALQASDDIWKSATVSVRLYQVPLWWQRPGWKVVFWTAGIVGAALFLLGVVMLTRYFVIKAARKKAFMTSLELRTIYAQINPHFIFNTLNTALFFIKRRKNDEAFTHVSKFSQLLRSYLSSSGKRYLSVEEEIVNLRNYIELQQSRFREIFSYEITVDNLDPANEYIPSLLLQPLVENAINHGLVPKEKAGHLHIGFKKEETGTILCIVDDNGIGREQAKLLKQHDTTERRSYGSKLIGELVSIFNKYEKAGIAITYEDKELPETGTRVIITIKNQPHEQRV